MASIFKPGDKFTIPDPDDLIDFEITDTVDLSGHYFHKGKLVSHMFDMLDIVYVPEVLGENKTLKIEPINDQAIINAIEAEIKKRSSQTAQEPQNS